MARFVVRRVAGMVAVLFAISVLTFLIFNVIPNGDPAERLAGHNASNEQIATIRHQWGFDRSVFVQYTKTMDRLFSGDLISYSENANVIDEIKDGIPRTLSLAIGAAILWMGAAIAIGLFTAIRAGKLADRLLTILALIGISMPVFW